MNFICKYFMLEFRLMYLKKYLGFVCFFVCKIFVFIPVNLCIIILNVNIPKSIYICNSKCRYTIKNCYYMIIMICLSFRVATKAEKAVKSFFLLIFLAKCHRYFWLEFFDFHFVAALSLFHKVFGGFPLIRC